MALLERLQLGEQAARRGKPFSSCATALDESGWSAVAHGRSPVERTISSPPAYAASCRGR
jgi:hypothetical protein